MKKFRHHSCFAKPRQQQAFRFPFVCFACRKSFKYPASPAGRVCPQCKGVTVMLSRKFLAPKAKDLAQWEKVRLLVAHGFHFYSVHDASGPVKYPGTLHEAESFVRRFAAQSAHRKG